MLISAYELARMEPTAFERLRATLGEGSNLIFMGFGTYSDLFGVLEYPMAADENYAAWLDHEREHNALQDACRNKYEAIKSDGPEVVEKWQRVIDVLREMRKSREALGLEAVYWDVG